ncbi:MBOAT family protein [uncultured Roseovarius sp.]|uniref:MBOAT family O-acyltransferase n=1 Tax=uncultured Roseovarius sp. TaxID=293344 RepID=UPI00262D167D|nr:MBOAT family protein [uncultured Roseovarius sp.]
MGQFANCHARAVPIRHLQAILSQSSDPAPIDVTFASIPFLFYFLPCFLALYFLLPFKNAVFLTGSLIFYAWGEPVFILLLLASITMNHVLARALSRNRTKQLLILGVGANLAALGVFKYAGFLSELLLGTSISLGLQLSVAPLELHLPLGISFYTFQAISFLVDIYRRDAQAPERWRDTALFISMFPQLIAGPIVRFHTVAGQIQERSHTLDRFASGARQFTRGLAQKILLANAFGEAADAAFGANLAELGPGAAWLGLICYTLQIYFDFAGYSNMALGLGRMMGFDFPENFNFPYMSRSVTEFWRRWHMSLSRWFREYLYIPLGGNRLSPMRTYLNLTIVFLLCGFWHGAEFAFIIWGAWHGAFLVLERSPFGTWIAAMPTLLRHCYLLLVVMLAWIPFRTEDLGDALTYFAALFGQGSGRVDLSLVYAPQLAILLPVGMVIAVWPLVAQSRLAALITDRMALLAHPAPRLALEPVWVAGLLILCAADLATGSYNPFIYFRF